MTLLRKPNVRLSFIEKCGKLFARYYTKETKKDSKHDIEEYIIKEVLNATVANIQEQLKSDIAFGYPDHSEIESVIYIATLYNSNNF